jgi:hypothetical protein
MLFIYARRKHLPWQLIRHSGAVQMSSGCAQKAGKALLVAVTLWNLIAKLRTRSLLRRPA